MSPQLRNPPAQSKRWTLIGLLICALGLAACGATEPQTNEAIDLPPDEAVNIRIQNESGAAIDRVELGLVIFDSTGTFETIYVDIADGTSSDYLPVDPVSRANYSRAFFVWNDESQGTDISLGYRTFLGLDELETGAFYSMVVGISDGDLALLDFTADEPPAAN